MFQSDGTNFNIMILEELSDIGFLELYRIVSNIDLMLSPLLQRSLPARRRTSLESLVPAPIIVTGRRSISLSIPHIYLSLPPLLG